MNFNKIIYGPPRSKWMLVENLCNRVFQWGYDYPVSLNSVKTQSLHLPREQICTSPPQYINDKLLKPPVSLQLLGYTCFLLGFQTDSRWKLYGDSLIAHVGRDSVVGPVETYIQQCYWSPVVK